MAVLNITPRIKPHLVSIQIRQCPVVSQCQHYLNTVPSKQQNLTKYLDTRWVTGLASLGACIRMRQAPLETVHNYFPGLKIHRTLHHLIFQFRHLVEHFVPISFHS